MEHPLDTELESAIGIGYAGVESYGFHSLETLQCMIERRHGGESGIVAIQCLEGDAVWEAGEAGKWSLDLAEKACAQIDNRPDTNFIEGCPNPTAFLLEHRDRVPLCCADAEQGMSLISLMQQKRAKPTTRRSFTYRTGRRMHI